MKGWSKTVSTICLSTGKSELAAVVRGAAEGLGMKSVLSDLGYQVKVAMASDATAAIGMVKRQGLGRIRHLAVSDLWVQQKIREGELRVSKVPEAENPADLFTKVLSHDHCFYLLKKLGFGLRSGRAAIAPIRAKVHQGMRRLGDDLDCHDGKLAEGGYKTSARSIGS